MLDALEDGVEREFFAIISISSSLLYENIYYLQVCLDNCAYKIIDKHMINYLDVNLFESHKN